MEERGAADTFLAPTFGQRLGGRVLDGLLFVPVFALLAVVLHGTSYWIVGCALVIAYEITAVLVSGQTFGKRIVGTRVVSVTPEALRPWQPAVRVLTYWIPVFVMLALGLRFLADVWILVVVVPILRQPLHRGLHDMTARTIVIPTRVIVPHA
jgi:uncharacterized RDD family membrane protein YckC